MLEQVYHQGDIIEYYIPKYSRWCIGVWLGDGSVETGNTMQLHPAIAKRYGTIQTKQGKILQIHKTKIRLKYSFDQELTELLETGTIKKKEQKENNKMAKFTTIGMIAKKKDGSGSYIKMDADVTLKKGQFISLQKKPTEEQVEANPKLKQRADKWPNWKVADLVLVSDD